MAEVAQLRPDYIFEVSWEVCNKVGGIYTVMSTKAQTLQEEWDDRLIFIGPDVWKGSGENPEFTEDKNLLKLWKEHAINEGLRVRVGRWNIPGNPIAILLDFTEYFGSKDDIFSHFWIKFQLDSLNGQWDYIEPALFGYAAGKVIECFYRYHLNSTDKIVAQFHEWMTGTGILHLKENAPQVATIFTTHATAVGRCIAGNGLPFYSKFESYNADQVARDFNVVSKHSLEKLSAINADCFTTVSELTGRECKRFLGKEPDLVTPNGFNDSMVPDAASFQEKRAEARKKLLQVAESLFDQKFPEDTLMVIKSGRYEFKNKGIDVFIDSVAELNKQAKQKRTILAFIFVPAYQTGPRKELLERLSQPDFANPKPGELLTHYLQGTETDPVLNQIKIDKIENAVDDKVKIIFAPTYLDGTDGIFNMSYYDVLIGFDLGIFPSYYEPWGYTPLEGIAFSIPAITTNLAGFGLAIQDLFQNTRKGVNVVDRTDDNYAEVVKKVSTYISDFAKKPADEVQAIRHDALELSKVFLWKNLIGHYKDAYSFALQKAAKREPLFRNKPQAEPLTPIGPVAESTPVWRNIYIQPELPATLSALHKLSRNLWWSWDVDAKELFKSIETELWHQCDHNPVVYLQSLSFAKIRKLEKDKNFISKLKAIEQQFDAYMEEGKRQKGPAIAYFSMEYGLNNYIKIYSGGLGILAGDYLKEASDNNTNIVAVGMLYKNGYFRQTLSLHGEQLAEADHQEPANLPVEPVNGADGKPLMISLAFPGRTAYARVWKLAVGRIPLYLFDTNVAENIPEDKGITDQLYGGDQKTRLIQEILLGIGGIRLLNALGIRPDVYHCNEGHAAFIGFERLHDLIKNENLGFEEALEVVRASTLFTTHTSVPAANDIFTEDMLRTYLAHHAQFFNISWDHLMGLGRANEYDHAEKFSMTFLASRLSQEINAVSRMHKDVSCDLLNVLWKDYKSEELHIGYVTNGVHYATWTATEWQQLFSTIAADFGTNLSNPDQWAKIKQIPDQTIWEMRKALKRKLLTALKEKVSNDLASHHENPKKILQLTNNLNEKALLIGFARRFATYKRSDLLFFDTERLAEIVNNAKQPVQFLYAGKAHPKDGASQDMIKQVVSISERPEFEGKVIFLENYNMHVAKLLVQGVDVWLNTPYRLMEASGTSGMKATMNGVLNFSVMDGWWDEGYQENAGWCLGAKPTYERQDYQNELDTETIYSMLEHEIAPLFFDRNEEGLPVEWINRIKNTLSEIAPRFTTTRMLDDYKNRFYHKLNDRSAKVKKDNYAVAKELAAWKRKVWSSWNNLEVISIDVQDNSTPQLIMGEELKAKIVIDLGRLDVSDIGIEIIFVDKSTNKNGKIVLAKELSVTSTNDHEAVYECKVPLVQAGVYEYAFRLYPKNALLPSRQDFDLVKWL